MQTVNETSAPNSTTGSGQSVMASLGQKVLSLFRGSKKSPVDDFFIDQLEDYPGQYFICSGSGMPYAGPYMREKDAKGQLTRLRKGYTPAARKV